MTVSAFDPVWLSVDDVKRHLRLRDDADDDLIRECAAAAEPVVERANPQWRQVGASGDDGEPDASSYAPDASTYRGAVMFAARLVRRRNSPAGIETLGESVAFVSRGDLDIERLLRTGAYRPPMVG